MTMHSGNVSIYYCVQSNVHMFMLFCVLFWLCQAIFQYLQGHVVDTDDHKYGSKISRPVECQSMPIHVMNQYRFIVNLNPGNNFLLNSNRNFRIFIHDNCIWICRQLFVPVEKRPEINNFLPLFLDYNASKASRPMSYSADYWFS